MPRAVDAKQIKWDYDPNRGIEFHLTSFQQIDQLIAQILEGAIDSFKLLIIPAIEEFTGLDLSALVAVLDELDLDFSSPVAFLTSLVNAIALVPEILITLLTSLLEQLFQPGNSDQLTSLLTALIGLLASLPTLLTSLAQALLSSFTDLLGLDFSSGDGLAGSIGGLLDFGGLLTQFEDLVLGTGPPAADMLPHTLPLLLGSTPSPLDPFFDNLRSFFGDVDFADPFFDLPAAIESFIGDVLTPAGLLATSGDLQNLLDTIWQALTGGADTGNLLSDLFDSLLNIPSGNVTGVGGPFNIGGSITSTWDQLIGGLVGAIGSGAGLADVFNISQDVSSRATLGQFSWDILGIRSNKSINAGFLPTSQSNIGLDKVALQSSAPTFALTQSTAITAYQRISESGQIGVVSWLGSGVTSITNAYVNIFRMDPSTGLSTLVHASSDIVGSLSGTMQHNVYSLPTPIDVAPGEVYGIELAVRGAGTHSVAGQSTWLPDHPSVYPRRLSSVRNSGTTAPPSTIAHSSLTYSTNVPFLEFGVSAGDVAIPHSPEPNLFNTPGTSTLPIPTWANYVDIVAIGGGGGGHQGGTFGIGGEGGAAAVWQTATWTRTTDFTGSPSISVTVAAGGIGEDGSGANGGTTTVAISGHTVTATGGVGANSFDIGGLEHVGEAVGNVTYQGRTYVGGTVQNTYGANGSAPGGGGAGGNWVSFQYGGNGAPGAVWIVFRQT